MNSQIVTMLDQAGLLGRASLLEQAGLLAQEEPQGGGILGLLIIVVPLGLLVYMMIVPQRKQRQRHADLLRKLDIGDEVVTTGGIVGTITFVEDDLFHLEVDDDVVIRVAKSAVARSTAEPDPSEAPPARRRGLLGGPAQAESSDDASDDDGASDESDPRK